MISENGALVEFYQGSVQNKSKSASAGRPIFEDRVFVRIQTPGDTRTVIDRIATDQDRQRFARALSIFERGIQITAEGTPLEEWPQITRSQVNELKHVGVLSVEVLAEVSDANIQRLGPGYTQLRLRARQYLEASADDAQATAAAREREALEERVRLLEEENAALRDRAEAQPKDENEKTNEAARRGRPRKAEQP